MLILKIAVLLGIVGMESVILETTATIALRIVGHAVLVIWDNPATAVHAVAEAQSNAMEHALVQIRPHQTTANPAATAAP